MYRLSVPIMLSSLSGEERRFYMRQCAEAGVERVFVAVNGDVIGLTEQERELLCEELEKALALVREYRM